jgi:cysteinyl-tRNA synthetase
MAIRLHDTLSGKAVALKTREPGRITMYGCGPTVYNLAHIGNARTFLWYDLIRRYLSYRGFDVTYVMNYTDVDDKIIERASIEDISPDAVARKYGRALEEDLRTLGVAPPDILCLATEHVEDMVKAVQGLIEKGVAYEADGNVFFSVEAFSGYGKLSGRSLEDMRAGERVEPSASKRHPLDFSLWKAVKESEPSWPSPWGPGRPGWHIECSVMSTKYLGMGFDLHLGASDLVFPHHENEIAQAEALAGTEPFVRLWSHAGLVQMEDEKMSKSLGNVVLAREVLERYPAEAVRYWSIGGSYRSQATFSSAALDDSLQAYERWRTFLSSARHALGGEGLEDGARPRRPLDAPEPGDAGAPYIARFLAAMDDDLNSPGALAAVHDLVREGNRRLVGAQGSDEADRRALLELTDAFVELTSVLGFAWPASEAGSDLVSGLVGYLLELRDQARAARDFERADSIRDKLNDLGVVIEDTPAGSRWRLSGGHSSEED